MSISTHQMFYFKGELENPKQKNKIKLNPKPKMIY